MRSSATATNPPETPVDAPTGPPGSFKPLNQDDGYSAELLKDGTHMRVFLPSHLQEQLAFVNKNQSLISKRPKLDDTESTIRRETHISQDEKAARADETSSDAATTPKRSKDDNVEITESARRYERQLRKVQAATRASTKLSPDQLQIVYNDPHLVVVNKPSGFLTVPGVHNNPNLLSLVYETLQERDEEERQILQQLEKIEHMIVHRLDMDTSGLIIFAKTKDSMAQLQAMFRQGSDQDQHKKGKRRRNRKKHRQHQQQDGDSNETSSPPPIIKPIQKEYEALLCGHLTPSTLENIHIDLPLQRDHRNPPFMRVATPKSEQEAKEVVKGLNHAGWKKIVKKNAKPSQTVLQLIKREFVVRTVKPKSNDNGGNETSSGEDCTVGEELPVTRVKLTPVTGRTHQLRVHCAAIGHPIVADPTYGIFGEASPNGGFDDSLVDQAFANICSTSRASTKLQLQIDQWSKEQQQVMCLHARKLKLNHPITGEELCFERAPSF